MERPFKKEQQVQQLRAEKHGTLEKLPVAEAGVRTVRWDVGPRSF